MALIIALFVFLEIFDLLRERIHYFRRLDFFDAMRVCGITERYIINREIIWRSSRIHMMNKMIAIFGISIFLLCSVDFIISVGLSTDVSSVNLPVTLGSLLAKIDSKQDILAIGYSLTHLGYIIRLPFEHLQGISVSFIIVFTLVCMYQIGNGFARRHHL
jgi:ABC-type microcin C transport system permease subunit YejE